MPEITSLDLDDSLPFEVTEVEAKAGFIYQDLHPGEGIPDFAVVLNLPNKHRIVKFQTWQKRVVYAHQIPEIIHGQKVFGDGVFYTDLDLAVKYAGFHSELGD